MQNFNVPTKDQVSESNQAIFDKLEKALGFVPNIYAYLAKNETALGDYLAFQNRKTTLTAKEKEVVNLTASQINGCKYCLSAHTAIGKMNGFSEDQILDIRNGNAGFDSKFHALAQFTKSVVENRGKATQESKDAFFEAGYSEANMIDVIFVVADITVTNFLNNLTEIAIDFPLAKEI